MPALHLLLLFALLLPSLSAQGDEIRLPRDLRRAALQLEAQPPVDDGQPVLVVDAEGAPIAGASVIVADILAVPRARRRAMSRALRAREVRDAKLNQLALAQAFGKRFVTDEQGRTKVARARRGVMVVLSGPLIQASTYVARPDQELREQRIPLVPEPGVYIQVLDHRGRPAAGVPIAPVRRNEHWVHPGRLQRTDAQGMVMLPPVTEQQRSWGNNRIEAWFPSKRPVGIDMPAPGFTNTPGKPLQIKLPETGQVRVYVQNEAGKPLAGLQGVELRKTNWKGTYTGAYIADLLKDDYADFRHVEVGIAVAARCRYQNSLRPQLAVDPGPRGFREMRVLTIKGVGAPQVLNFTVHTPQGKPAAMQRLVLLYETGQSWRGENLRLGLGGDFETKPPQEYVDDEEAMVELRLRGVPRATQYLGALRMPLAELLQKPSGSVLKLQTEVVRARGVVVDQAGKPVPNLLLQQASLNGPDQRRSYGISGARHHYMHCPQTDAAGRFELRSVDEGFVPPKLRVWNQAGSEGATWLILEGAELAAGDDNKLVICRAGRLEGSVQGLPETGAQRTLAVRLLREGETNKSYYSNPDPQRKGAFVFGHLAPGKYQLRIQLGSREDVALEVKDLVIEPGQTNRDPRVQGLDFSKIGRAVSLSFVDPQGKPVQGLTVWDVFRRAKGGTSSSGYATDASGKVTLLVPEKGVDFVAVSSSLRYRPVHGEGLKESKQFQLQPALRARFKVENLPDLRNVLRLRLDVRAVHQGPRPWYSHLVRHRGSLYLEPDGSLELGFPSPGTWRVQLTPESVHKQDVNRQRNRFTIPFEIKVEADQEGKPQLAEVKVLEGDKEALAEMVEELLEAQKDRRR